MEEQYYYFSLTGQTYSAYQMQTLFGVNPTTASISTLNTRGFYPVISTSPNFDVNLYNSTFVWTLVSIAGGQGAEKTYSPIPKPLPEAKVNASEEAKAQSNDGAETLVSSSGVNIDIWTGAASQDPLDRPPVYDTLLGEMSSIGDSLAATLTAIDTATSVDEINNIINPPTGIINTGRGAGLGPEDLNPSYYVEFNSVSLTEAETELYVPGTATVIPYDAGLPPPYTFDSIGDCFNPGDYLMQIRVTATSEVIAEFEVPFNVLNEDVSF